MSCKSVSYDISVHEWQNVNTKISSKYYYARFIQIQLPQWAQQFLTSGRHRNNSTVNSRLHLSRVEIHCRSVVSGDDDPTKGGQVAEQVSMRSLRTAIGTKQLYISL